MSLSLNGKCFRSVANTSNGEVGAETTFHFAQDGCIVTATYSGGQIIYGQLLATMSDDGILDMRYHHLNKSGEFMLGKCISTPEILSDGRIKFHEQWQWLSGDMSSGNSVMEEMKLA